MRPVDRGDPANCSIVIDVGSYAALIRSLKNDSLTFKVHVIWALFHTYSPDLWQILDRVWLRVTQADLGEITAPSLTSLAWDNFFLSCTPCNVGGSGKGTNSQRATVQGWPGNTNNEQQYFTRIKDQYLWPEDAVAYRRHVPRLEYYDAGTTTWLPVPATESVRLGFVTGQNYTQRQVTADIHLDNSSTRYSRDVRVWMVSTGAASGATNDLIGLNKDGKGTGNDPTAPPPGRTLLTRFLLDCGAPFPGTNISQVP